MNEVDEIMEDIKRMAAEQPDRWRVTKRGQVWGRWAACMLGGGIAAIIMGRPLDATDFIAGFTFACLFFWLDPPITKTIYTHQGSLSLWQRVKNWWLA